MVNNNSNTLSIILNTAHKIIPESRVLLFGSRARKDNKDDSDYDFLIVTKFAIDVQEKRNLKSLMRKELAKFKIPVDILIQSEAEVESKKGIPGHIIRQVLKEGIAL